MRQSFPFILFLSLLLGSCIGDECPIRPDTRTLTPVIFEPFTIDFLPSHAMKTEWLEGDRIAIFSDRAVKKNGSVSTASITYTRGATAGSWTPPDAEQQWYLTDAALEYNFYAYYPVGTADSYLCVEIPDISGQDGTKTLGELKAEDDFLRGTATATQECPTADLQMVRVFTIINLAIKIEQDAFAGNTASLSEVKLISTGSLPLENSTPDNKATVDLSTGRVTCPDGLPVMTLHPTTPFTLTPAELSIPVKIYPQPGTGTLPALRIQFTVGGKTSAYLNLGSTAEFLGGHIYNFPIEIGADIRTVGIGDPTIIDWEPTDGPPLKPVIPY